MFYPMFAMVLLTAGVAIIAVRVRFKSVSSGQVPGKYYRLMQGAEVPEIVAKTGRNFNNLLEVPLLFYVACTLYIALDISSAFGLIIASLFVLFRIVHSAIHIAYNHVLHRLAAFTAASSVCC